MAFSNLIQDIYEGTGKFDTEKKYLIVNSTEEDIVVTWALKEPEVPGSGKYTIKAGETGGPYQQYLAYHIVKALVSREMLKEGKMKFFGSAEFRAPYEKKFLKEIDEDSRADSLTERIRKEERAKIMEELKQEENEEGKEAPERGRPKKEEKLDIEEFEGANR